MLKQNYSFIRIYSSLKFIDLSAGIIITNSTLVVKNARRESEGRYQCVAYNSEGRGDSSELFVQVFCK